MKCPVCGIMHRSKQGARGCLSSIQMDYDPLAILGDVRNDFQEKLFKQVKEDLASFKNILKLLNNIGVKRIKEMLKCNLKKENKYTCDYSIKGKCHDPRCIKGRLIPCQYREEIKESEFLDEKELNRPFFKKRFF